MSKLKTKQQVMDWYWIDYLDYCIRDRKGMFELKKDKYENPTVEGFWKWYMTVGPLGVNWQDVGIQRLRLNMFKTSNSLPDKIENGGVRKIQLSF